MRRNIYCSEIEGKPAVCFDTGLDPRSFARTKMSQCLTESGLIVHPDGSRETWTPSEVNEINGRMVVWGHGFSCKRLDLLLEDAQTAALQAVVSWIRATLTACCPATGTSDLTSASGQAAFNPGAAFIGEDGSVFFAPENLSSRCLLAEGAELDHYNCSDLKGMDAAAFCAGSMLYRIFAKQQPYADKSNISQDIREGVFLPLHLAAPGLNKELCSLIQSALLLPAQKRNSEKKLSALPAQTGEHQGMDILNNLLELLTKNEGGTAAPSGSLGRRQSCAAPAGSLARRQSCAAPAGCAVSSLFHPLSETENAQIEKEKAAYFKKGKSVKTKRLVVRNKNILLGIAGAFILVVLIAVSLIKSRAERPTTAGMDSITVVSVYYEAFSALNHELMDACLAAGRNRMNAGKSDINTATFFFAADRVRQAYDMASRAFIPAEEWKKSGGELPAPNVFGVTDLSVEYVSGSEDSGLITYRAGYLIWAPGEEAIIRSDILTLARDRRNNWRITEISRTEGERN